jgi:hypothetical protein
MVKSMVHQGGVIQYVANGIIHQCVNGRHNRETRQCDKTSRLASYRSRDTSRHVRNGRDTIRHVHNIRETNRVSMVLAKGRHIVIHCALRKVKGRVVVHHLVVRVLLRLQRVLIM